MTAISISKQFDWVHADKLFSNAIMYYSDGSVGREVALGLASRAEAELRAQRQKNNSMVMEILRNDAEELAELIFAEKRAAMRAV